MKPPPNCQVRLPRVVSPCGHLAHLGFPYLIASLVLGPLAYYAGAVAPEWVVPKEVSEFGGVTRVDPVLKGVLVAVIAASLGWEIVYGTAAELLAGIAMVIGAVTLGDWLGVAVERAPLPGVIPNWGTPAANATAGALLFLAKVLVPGESGLLLGKFCSTFVGCVSAFGAFSEDVAQNWLEDRKGLAVRVWVINFVVGAAAVLALAM
mmetsp:Transcript_20911/g.46741  ORF Transcript_20911/g.46741 Transcript_20911/m.46741 type:complete len:207 (-) Transcript_20911:108-728(-)